MKNDVMMLPPANTGLIGGTMRNVTWTNKYCLPPGYEWNEDGYVITAVPYPFIRTAIGLRYSFLVKKLGEDEYIRQNVIALRLLNEDLPKISITMALKFALKRTGMYFDDVKISNLADEVYALDRVPVLDSNVLAWRTTWFSETCEYNTISKVVKVENTMKIDSDRELMKIDEKYITHNVAEFTGFSRRRIDEYWQEKEWSKKSRTLYTLEESLTKLEADGIASPSMLQIQGVSGLSARTVWGMKRELDMIKKAQTALMEQNDND